MSSPRTPRIAVVGAGGIGAAAHLPAIVSLRDEVELVAIVDPDEQRRTDATAPSLSTTASSHEEANMTRALVRLLGGVMA